MIICLKIAADFYFIKSCNIFYESILSLKLLRFQGYHFKHLKNYKFLEITSLFLKLNFTINKFIFQFKKSHFGKIFRLTNKDGER